MPTNHDFDPADPLPRFLVRQTEAEGLEDVRGGGITISRVFLSILVAAATAAGVAALTLGNPVALLTEVTASLVGNPSPQPGNDPSPPAIQTADKAPALVQSKADAKADLKADAKADAEAAPPRANDTPPHEQVAAVEPAAAEPAAKDSTSQDPVSQDPASREPTEAIAPSSEALFRRFQAWLSDQDAQAKAEPVQPVRDAPTQVEPSPPAQADENVSAPAPHRPAQKHRRAVIVHNASAETRAQTARRPIPRTQDAHAARPPARPVQDARAQEPSPGAGAPAAPSLLPPVFGQRN